MRDLKEFWRKSQNDLIFTQATALAYTTLLSLVPLLAVAFYLFKAFGGFEKLAPDIQDLIESNLAPAFSDKISTYLDNIINNVNAGAVGIFGVFGFIITTITTLSTVEKTFNLIWGVKHTRSLGNRITIYWTLMTIGPLLLGASLMFGTKAVLWLKNDHGAIAVGLVFLLGVVPYLASGVLFSFLYYFIPCATVNPKDAVKAGLVTGLVFELAKFIYSFYAQRTIGHDAVYGALIVIPVFLLWLYVVWLIVLFGAELCCFLQFHRLGLKYKFHWEERLTPFAISDILEFLSHSGQRKGGGLGAEEILCKLQMPLAELMSHLHFLEDEGWIVEFDGKYHTTLSRSDFDMSEILKRLEHHRYVPKGKIATQVYNQMKALWKGE